METETNQTGQPNRRLRPEEVVTLLNEVRAIIASGVPVGLGMRQAAQGFSGNLDLVAQRLAERIERGASIEEACRDEPGIPADIKPVLVAGFRCGESSVVLKDVAEMTRSLESLNRSLQIGMIYPLILTVTALCLFGFIGSMLLKALVVTYVDLQAELPTWIKWLEPLILNSTLVWIAVGVAVLFVAVWGFITSQMSGGVISIPGVSQIRHDFQIAHFSGLLSLLVKYEVPLPESLRVAGETVSGGKLAQSCEAIATSIEGGQSISSALETTQVPKFLSWLIIAGHQDSQLARSLDEAAKFYRRRAEIRSRWLSKFAPAVAVLIFGGGATFVYVLTVFGPMTDLWEKITAI